MDNFEWCVDCVCTKCLRKDECHGKYWEMFLEDWCEKCRIGVGHRKFMNCENIKDWTSILTGRYKNKIGKKNV